MPPRKRAAPADETGAADPTPKRRSSRQAAAASASSSAPTPSVTTTTATKSKPSSTGRKVTQPASPAVKPSPGAKQAKDEKVAKSATKQSAAKKDTKKDAKKDGEKSDEVPARQKRDAVTPDPDPDSIPVRNPDVEHRDETWYWLLKAEPESRFEDGVDVRFSIDDLRSRTKPEGWDGIRNHSAKNNLRAMNAGDMAFFYHSNCKNPGIVGTMEIVREHSEDKSARRPGTPYYDPQSTREKPRWSLVHVEFRSKFAVPIYLPELRELGKAAGSPLESMQLLKQSRLSVSKVSASEWKYLCELANEKAKEAGLKHET